MGQLEDMQVFVRVVDAGGIGLAAKQLGIAKSAVSRRLADLEKRLGVTLINRTTRRSNLTSEGQSYYTRSHQLINDIEELNNLTSDPDCSLNGTLRISVPLSFGLLHLTPVLDLFSKEHPELHLDIEFTDRKTDLIEGGFDLAFRIGDLEDSSLKARKISPIRLICCSSPRYLKQHGIPKNAEDIKESQHLIYSIGNYKNLKLIDNNGATHTITPTKSKITANNGDFLTAMAVAGHGVIIHPTFIVWEAIKKGDLVPILSDFTLPELNAYIVYPQTRYTSRKIRLFIDFVIEHFGDDPYWDKDIR